MWCIYVHYHFQYLLVLICIYRPGPSIAANLNVDEGMISLTMSLYMLGLAIGHIAYGPWADKVGRKSP